MLPETREDYSSKIPALKTLMALGWQYLSSKQCLAKRGSNRGVILKDELINQLKKYRFEYKGQMHPLSANAIEQIIREITSPGLNDGLSIANERIYNKLCLGITVTEFIDGKRVQPNIPIIDWFDITNNTFQVTDELEVLATNGTHTRRPDIVCYVNGIPLVVIEAKRPDSNNPNKNRVAEGISQNIRNQKNDEIPLLFSYSQVLLSISGTDARFGTTKTPATFWAVWREEILSEEHFNTVKNTDIETKQKDALFSSDEPKRVIELKKQAKYFSELWSKNELPTEQDRVLTSLLTPARLLEFIRFFIIFDKKKGKIAARYQQFFGIKALIARINMRKPSGGREGGVIWHTTGSGKSFTMVFLTKALLLHDSLKECRILVVTDRTNLEKQLAKTFRSGGAFGAELSTKKEGAQTRVTSGRDLAKRIGKGNERIIFSIINKFNTASKQAECYNPSDNLIVLVDEGHRSHGGENHQRMHKMLPNASYVAFTGTPLLKGEKKQTTNKFGPIVHAYTMQRAVEDKAVTPLLYEERKQILDVNANAIDRWFEKLTSSLSPEQQRDLKKKFSKKGEVYKSENRLELIAWDLAMHFKENFKKLGLDLKGQLATDSKQSAIRYKKILDNTGLVTSAVIISPPDSREGHKDVDEASLPEVQQWWKDNVGNDYEKYEREMLENFATEGAPDILIVVDKLLTGFDEPKNAVLYIDKQLKEHNLIQAIARVNRLHDNKQYGLLIDYRGILRELDTAIADYQDLEQRTQGGYDIDELDGLYAEISTEYKRLPSLYEKMLTVFKDVDNRKDLEQYRQVLVPRYVHDADGNDYDKSQSVREDFYDALTDFGMCLKIALSSRSFFEDGSFSDSLIEEYKESLRFFTNLRKIAKQDAHETIDYSVYDKQIRRLVDKHVVGESIVEPYGVILVNEMGKGKPEEWSVDKTRNETDIIKSRIKKTIEQTLADDPYAQKVFSKLLLEAIDEAEALFDYPHKQYAMFDELEKNIEKRSLDNMLALFGDNRHAQAYFGAFKLVLGEKYFNELSECEVNNFVDESFEIDEIVNNAVGEHSLNMQNIDAQIRKCILPRLYGSIGLDKAKEVLDKIIEITRIGLSKGTH